VLIRWYTTPSHRVPVRITYGLRLPSLNNDTLTP
jgi:hypothetical protein